MARERWTRKCGECGWIDPDASYPSKDLAEERVYTGFEGNLQQQLPRCPECGSLDIEANLASDPQDARGGEAA